MAQNEKVTQNAPAQATTDRVATAKAKAQAYLADVQESKGTVWGLSPDCTPYWFVPAEVGVGKADALRRDLSARGFERNAEAIVSGIGNAEVWEIPSEVHAMLAARRDQENAKALRYARRDVEVRV